MISASVLRRASFALPLLALTGSRTPAFADETVTTFVPIVSESLVGPRARPVVGPPLGPSVGPLDSLTVSYEIAGVKVIHRPINATDVVAVNLYLLGGARQVTPVTAGAEQFLLHASEYGTQRYPGEAARLALAHTGSWISVVGTPDYTRFSFRGIKQEFDSTWAVFADRLMHPALDSAAMAITRGQLLISVNARNESPESQAAFLADSLAFETHPYAIPSLGTPASIAALTADDLRKFAAENMMTSRMVLVVVGDVPRAQLEQAVASTLGTLPRGNYTWTLPDAWPAKAARVVAVQRRLPTNYIFGYFSGPLQSSPDYAAFDIATSYLGNVLEDVIRGEGLSYSAGAMTMSYGATGGGIYVSTVRPDTVVKIINNAIDYIQAEALPRSSLLRASKRYLSGYHYQTESSAEQAHMLAMAQLYNGDYRLAGSHGDVLRKVTGGDVRKVARQYIKHIQYGYVGDTTKAPVKLMLKP